MGIVKFFFPVVATTGLGGMVVFNRRILGNSEEVEISEMSKGYEDVESSWGEKREENAVQVSFWKKGEEGYQRSREGREETHKNIFIFDLCNAWIKFGGQGERKEDEKNDETEGYGYTWSDVCQIVKGEKNDINWLEFVTSVMNSNIVDVNQRCCGEVIVCKDNTNWNKGVWISKCFEEEKKKSRKNKRELEKVCNSFWSENKRSLLNLEKVVEESKNGCIDEIIGRKISEKIKISRSKFGDSGNQVNDVNKYWCSGQNGYENKEGNLNGNKKISVECKSTLKKEIKKFVDKQKKENKSSPEENNNKSCFGIYDEGRFEIKCQDGWVLKSSKSY